jgi:hypothetical protein
MGCSPDAGPRARAYRRPMLRLRTIAPLAITATVLAASLGAPAASAAPRQQAKYPPAKLWYRVDLSFHGEWVPPHVPPYPAPPALPTDPSLDRDASEDWVLHSRNAILLRLRCADLSDHDDVRIFTIEREIRGRRRPVGGCPRRDGPFEPTVTFAAELTGRVVDWRYTEIHGESYRGGGAIRCGGLEHRTDLIAAQGLDGLVSTQSSVVRGFDLDVGAAEPIGAFSFVSDYDGCYRVDNGAEATPPDTQSGTLDFPGDIRGDEYISKSGHPDGPFVPAARLVNFRFPADRFGRDWGVARQVSQALNTPPFPQPLPPGVWHPDRKAYTYAFHFDACPRRGLDVENC